MASQVTSGLGQLSPNLVLFRSPQHNKSSRKLGGAVVLKFIVQTEKSVHRFICGIVTAGIHWAVLI